MTIAIEERGDDLLCSLLDAFAETARELGHRVRRDPGRTLNRRDVLSIVWNGRHHRLTGPGIYCEHGWLPIWDFQVSPGGVNADSHAAPFRWDGEALPERERAAVARHLERARRGGIGREYMRYEAEAADDLPERFLLVPLQMERDTNILRHVPRALRRMQSFADLVAASDPPLPIVFKQHPADRWTGRDHHLALRLRRSRDRIRPHGGGNVHRILKHPGCAGVVALNSNVVHDALLWEVPAVALGRNVWPREGPSPFLRELPRDWDAARAWFHEPATQLVREAYVRHLARHQWTLEDARDPARVEALIRSAAPARTRPRRARPRPTGAGREARAARGVPLLNVVARDGGWLFEDLGRHFARAGGAEREVRVSATPLARADAWIFLRAREAARSPRPDRTVVQIHDLFDGGAYRPGGERHVVARCGGVVLTSPGQRAILEESGIALAGRRVLERPLGALRAFELRGELPERFTLGWVGRPVVHRGEEVKRAAWLKDVAEGLHARGRDFRLVLLGERLGELQRWMAGRGVDCAYLERRDHPIERYPAVYRGLDALLVTARLAAGPNALYEALASGVPAVATPAGHVPTLLQDGVNGYLVRSPAAMVDAAERVLLEREDWFAGRAAIRESLGGWTLESWIEENLELAAALAGSECALAGGPA